MQTIRMALLGGVAIAALAPCAAHAQSAREKQLETRVEQLESDVAALREELRIEREERAKANQRIDQADTTATTTATRVAALEARPAPVPMPEPAKPADGFKVGGTTFKMSGYIKTVAMFSRWDDGDVATGSLGRDFYLPQAIPIGGVRESTDNDYSAKQTRLGFSFDSSPAGHTLKGYIEADFQTAPGTQGSERTTNGYDLALRRAYVQYDNLTVGQEWSTFQNVVALPESTDFVGATEGTVFVRQPLIRYTKKLSPQTSLQVAIENADTASTTLGTTALVDNDDSHLPDLVARLNYSGGLGDFTLAGVVRQLAVDNGTVSDRAAGWGVSLAGKVPLGTGKVSDLRFMATYGSGIGRYVGLNFAPDAILDAGAGTLETPNVFAAFGAVRLGIAPSVRVNLIGSYQNVDYPGGLPTPALAGLNQQAWSGAGNIFWSPAKGFDLGMEYRHGNRKLVSGAQGQLDRLEFAAKYSF